MVIECCAQERTYLRFYGSLGERFCMIKNEYQVCSLRHVSTPHCTRTARARAARTRTRTRTACTRPHALRAPGLLRRVLRQAVHDDSPARDQQAAQHCEVLRAPAPLQR